MPSSASSVFSVFRPAAPRAEVEGFASALEAEAYLMKQEAEALARRTENLGIT
jgi:hypothetical protein